MALNKNVMMTDGGTGNTGKTTTNAKTSNAATVSSSSGSSTKKTTTTTSSPNAAISPDLAAIEANHTSLNDKTKEQATEEIKKQAEEYLSNNQDLSTALAKANSSTATGIRETTIKKTPDTLYEGGTDTNDTDSGITNVGTLPLEKGLVDYLPVDNGGGDTSTSNVTTNNTSTTTTATPTVSTTQYLLDAYNNMLNGYLTQIQGIKDQYSNIADQYKAANQASTEAALASANRNYNQSIQALDQEKATQDLLKRINADNLILQNTAAGNLGGIGQAQYSAQQASYDKQMLQIELEAVNLKSELDYQIAQLQAQGDYELANQLAELGMAQLSDLNDQYNTLLTMSYSYANALDSNSLDAQQLAYNKALTLLQQGISNSTIASTLGITEDESAQIANYYKTAQDLDLATAQANLYSSSNTGGSGSGDGTISDGTTYEDSLGQTWIYDSASGGYVLYKNADGTLAQSNDTDKTYVNDNTKNTYVNPASADIVNTKSSLNTTMVDPSTGINLSYTLSSVSNYDGSTLTAKERNAVLASTEGMTQAEYSAAKKAYDVVANAISKYGSAKAVIPGLSKDYSKLQSSSSNSRNGALTASGLTEYLSLYNTYGGDPAKMASAVKTDTLMGTIDTDQMNTILYLIEVIEQSK